MAKVEKAGKAEKPTTKKLRKGVEDHVVGLVALAVQGMTAAHAVNDKARNWRVNSRKIAYDLNERFNESANYLQVYAVMQSRFVKAFPDEFATPDRFKGAGPMVFKSSLPKSNHWIAVIEFATPDKYQARSVGGATLSAAMIEKFGLVE